MMNGDIVFIGKNRDDYGEAFNNNILHLLEHFASKALESGNPDFSNVIHPALKKPMEGQIWYNKTKNIPNVFNGRKWNPLLIDNGSVAGNSGVILSGNQLPRPQNPITGEYYDYSQCTWNISPFGWKESQQFRYMECYTDSQATVFMRYMPYGSLNLIDEFVNYQIIAIDEASKTGKPPNTPNIPLLTATPTRTPQATPNTTPDATPTVTPTLTRTPNVTANPTATPTPTRTSTPLASVTPTVTKTPSITPTVTPTITPSTGASVYLSDMGASVAANGQEVLIGFNTSPSGLCMIYSHQGVLQSQQWLLNDDPAIAYAVRVVDVSNPSDLAYASANINQWYNMSEVKHWMIVSATPMTVSFTVQIYKINPLEINSRPILASAVITLQIT